MLNIAIHGSFAETESQERGELRHLLQHVEQQIGDGITRRGDIIDRNKRHVGFWQYDPEVATA
jgi:hypothetical protein